MPQKNSKWAKLAQRARVRAKAKGWPCEIDRHWVRSRVDQGRCELSGIPFQSEEPWHPFSASIDRIDPNLGYTKENCQVILWMLNAAKGVASQGDFLCYLRQVSEAMHGRT